MIATFTRRFALIVVGTLAIVSFVPLLLPGSAFGQHGDVACASALWLEPLATPEAARMDDADSASPAWMTAELIDACSGQTFALADFAGKTVYIEPMATWCTNCRGQLTRLKEAATQLPVDEQDRIVLVALSSEVDLPREDLADYAVHHDFPFLFAVMSPEMLKAMVEDLGREVAVPPATPHLIVAPDGTVGPLRTGSTSSEELLTLLAEAAQPASP